MITPTQQHAAPHASLSRAILVEFRERSFLKNLKINLKKNQTFKKHNFKNKNNLPMKS